MFGDAIDYAGITTRRRKFFPLHPRKVTMAPMGHLHFHPEADHYCADFAAAPLHHQAHFIHEMVHVWQTQTLGRWHLLLRRHPRCRYHYTLRPGWQLKHTASSNRPKSYGHAFLLRRRAIIPGAPSLKTYDTILRTALDAAAN